MRGFIKGFKALKSEIVLKSLPKFSEPAVFEQSYKDLILSTPDHKITRDLFTFPRNEFNFFPRTSIENLVKTTYDAFKEKNKLTVGGYNSMLHTYINHEIDFDIFQILNDMKDHKIQPDDQTLSILVDLYCSRGDMASAQNVMNEITKKGYFLSKRLKSKVYGGFIRSKKYDEAENFLKEENLNENDFDLLISKAQAFADIGQFNDLKETMKVIQEIDSRGLFLSAKDFYCSGLKARMSDSELDEIISLGNIDKDPIQFCFLIMKINRFGFYSDSLRLLNKFSNLNYPSYTATLTFATFNKQDCPINIYKSLIANFSEFIQSSYSHLFSNMDFDTAFEISKETVNENNGRLLLSNLFRKAFEIKSRRGIRDALNFGRGIRYHDMLLAIQFSFIPLLMESDIVKEPEEILNFLPRDKRVIVVSLLFHYLCKGDYASFNSLLEKHPGRDDRFICLSKYNAYRILNSTPFAEIDKLMVEANKVFSPFFVNWLVGRVIYERMIKSFADHEEAAVKESIDMAKRLAITYSPANIQFFKKSVPECSELFDQLTVDHGLVSEKEVKSAEV